MAAIDAVIVDHLSQAVKNLQSCASERSVEYRGRRVPVGESVSFDAAVDRRLTFDATLGKRAEAAGRFAVL
eukprot:1351049-Pleurochrysis_carterae.AAC.1